MSEEAGEHPSITERITEKIHEYRGSSSSSDSDNEKPSSYSTRKKRLFGRRDPLHTVFGGGKSADIILWRNKHMSGGILAGVTVIWLLFEWMGYHLLTFICHSLIFLLALSFIWSIAASFVNRSPPKFPEVILPEDMFLSIAHAVIAGLWVVSVIGSWFSFLTLFYIVFLITYMVPALYEKYEDQVDSIAEKAMVEIDAHHAVLDEEVLQKIPRGPFTYKKQL